jgi:hypothetical protein
MPGIDVTRIEDSAGAEVTGGKVQQQRVIMPSSRHSVLAKAARYRSEPDRVRILVHEPLVAVVHGLHADHSVRQMGERLVCSCERFGRGQVQCAHVLVVEHYLSSAPANSTVTVLRR